MVEACSTSEGEGRRIWVTGGNVGRKETTRKTKT
jgi:hypothetical protein